MLQSCQHFKSSCCSGNRPCCPHTASSCHSCSCHSPCHSSCHSSWACTLCTACCSCRSPGRASHRMCPCSWWHMSQHTCLLCAVQATIESAARVRKQRSPIVHTFRLYVKATKRGCCLMHTPPSFSQAFLGQTSGQYLKSACPGYLEHRSSLTKQ
jgi:hypothetical protein